MRGGGDVQYAETSLGGTLRLRHVPRTAGNICCCRARARSERALGVRRFAIRAK